MKKIRFTEHVLPHLVAVGIFLVITVFFFKPVFFDHKTLEQHDIQQWEGSSKSLRDYRAQSGEEGLWAESMFSGMPAYLINVEWGNKPVSYLKKVVALSLPHPYANIYLAFISYYILLLCFGIRPYLAIAGAIAFGLSTYMIIGLSAGHNARIGAIAFMPMVLGGIHLAFRGRLILALGLTTAALALHLRENHLQITYYLAMIAGVYGIIRLVEAVREKRTGDWLRSAGILVVAAVIAVASFIGPLWSITEYSQSTIRGKSELKSARLSNQENNGLTKTYAFEYSNGILEPLTLVVPNFYGGTSANYLVQDRESETYKALVRSGNEEMANQLAGYTSAYWGPQSYSSPYYAGAIIFFLFGMGIAFAQKKYVWWLVPLTILGIMMSWGNYFSGFNYALFDYLPGYSKFRSVTFALIIPLVAMPLLGMLGLEKLWQDGLTKEKKKTLLIVLASTGGLCLFLFLFPGVLDFIRDAERQLPSWFTSALAEDRKGLLRSDAFRSLMFIVSAFVVIYFDLLKKFSPLAVYAFFIIMMIGDLGSVNGRYLSEEKYRRTRSSSITNPTAADQQILKDKSYYRVYNLQNPFNEARTSYFHHSVGGYHGAKLRRYQDLIDSCLVRETSQFIEDAQAGVLNFPQYGILNMLNTKYLVYGEESGNIFVNPSANGSAWFVREVIPVTTAAEELQQVCAINTKRTAVIDVSNFKTDVKPVDSTGTITLVEHKPNYLKYESIAAAPGLGVFSEIYYEDGWKATIDGKEASILRANYVLRALEMPAGKHTVEFHFEPEAYTTGNQVTMAGSWLVILVLLGSIGISLRKEKE